MRPPASVAVRPATETSRPYSSGGPARGRRAPASRRAGSPAQHQREHADDPERDERRERRTSTSCAGADRSGTRPLLSSAPAIRSDALRERCACRGDIGRAGPYRWPAPSSGEALPPVRVPAAGARAGLAGSGGSACPPAVHCAPTSGAARAARRDHGRRAARRSALAVDRRSRPGRRRRRLAGPRGRQRGPRAAPDHPPQLPAVRAPAGARRPAAAAAPAARGDPAAPGPPSRPGHAGGRPVSGEPVPVAAASA